MINFDEVTKGNLKEHNPNWSVLHDHLYTILIFGGSGCGKTNLLYNLINYQPDIYELYLYSEDLYEAKYKLLINKQESAGLKHLNKGF